MENQLYPHQNIAKPEQDTDNNVVLATHELSSDYLYLEKLEFKPELRNGFLNFFVSNFRVVILLIVLLSLWGASAYSSLPRESNPEVKIPIAVVMTAYPGASPADVEELITKKIENKISGLKDISKINSTSANSISSVTVEFDAKADLDGSLRSLRDQINSVKNDLPSEATDPVVKEISMDDSPIWTGSFFAPVDGRTLRSLADDLKSDLEKIPGVREVNVSGGDQIEFSVAYDPDKLTFYNLSPNDANQLIKAANLVIPAGNFDGRQFSYPVRADARFFTVEKLANLPLFHTDNGSFVLLKDIAKVSESNIKKTVYSRFAAGGDVSQPSISIQVVKKTGGNIVNIAEAVKKTADEKLSTWPAGSHYDVTIDTADQIKKDFEQLTHDFILTLLLVGGVLFLIVGLKEALVAGLAVPLVFFATFGVMQQLGISLNFLSTFSLILALGLLVDDAIVVVSATKQYLKTGKYTPEEAVLLVLNDFKVVLLTTTLTTVWAFLPLLSSTGIMGQFIKSIPITVSVTLISSLIIALLINHPLAAYLERIRLTRGLFRLFIVTILVIGLIALIFASLLIKIIILIGAVVMVGMLFKWRKKGGLEKMIVNEELVDAEWNDDDLIKKKLKEQGSHVDATWSSKLIHGVIKFDRFLPIYEKYLRLIITTKTMRTKVISGVAALFILAVMMPVSGIVGSTFFPTSDFEMLSIKIEAPAGTKLAETDKIVKQVEEKLLKYKEIDNYSTLIGGASSLSRMGSGSNSSNLASITPKLVKEKDRKLKSYELADVLTKDFSTIRGAIISVESPRGGPPSGRPFEARIIGDDLQVLDKIAHDLESKLANIKGVTNIDVSLKESPADYTFTLDPARLEYYNLNAAYVGSVMRMAISGTEVTTVLKDGDELKVVARFDEKKLPSLEALQNLQIINLKKQPVFLKDVAKIELKPSVESITRLNQKRVVVLSAGVVGKTNPAEVLKQFKKKKKKDYKMPNGYELKYGGENEQNAQSVMSILVAMIFAGLLIVSTLVIQFNSFKKAIIVLVTIPLALIGVFFGMAVVGIDLSFPGLIGILALFGIVVKNAIILIDKINLNLKSKIPFMEAVIDAGKSRLEAIFITSICTILGIVPITLSNGTWMALGSAVIFGLLLSSFLTLFMVPVLFVTFIKPNERF